MQLFRRSDARSGHPTSQGVTLRALGGNASSRALLVLDGVPQTDPFGGWVNWPAYDPDDLAEIRVVRGGGSVANGPGALAGTIEMTSRSDAGVSGEIDGGSRDSLEARGRLGIDAGAACSASPGRGERSDGFVPVTRRHARTGRRGAPYREWSGRARWVAPVGGDTEFQASVDGFHDWRTRGTDFTRQPHQRRRCLAAPGRPRFVAMERARLLAMAQPDEQLRERESWLERRRAASRCNIRCHRTGLAGASSCGRRCLMALSCASARTPGGRPANCASSIPTSAETDSATCIWRRELDRGRLRRGERRPWLGHADGRSAGRSLECRRRAPVRADDRDRRCPRPTSIIPRATAGCRPRAAESRGLSAVASAFALQPISGGECRR